MEGILSEWLLQAMSKVQVAGLFIVLIVLDRKVGRIDGVVTDTEATIFFPAIRR